MSDTPVVSGRGTTPAPVGAHNPGAAESNVGDTFASAPAIAFLTALWMLIAVVLITFLIQLWPEATCSTAQETPTERESSEKPGPDVSEQQQAESRKGQRGAAGEEEAGSQSLLPCSVRRMDIRLLGSWTRLSVSLTTEQALILLVIVAGALGALVHVIRSFYWYVGQRELKRSWLLMYVLRPFVGSLLGLVFYLVIRGGFVQGVGNLPSPVGCVAVALLAGMFSEQAVLKLKDVADIVFSKAEKGKDTAEKVRSDSTTPSADQRTSPPDTDKEAGKPTGVGGGGGVSAPPAAPGK